jgi:hypothetical protein
LNKLGRGNSGVAVVSRSKHYVQVQERIINMLMKKEHDVSSSDGLELNIAQIRLHSGYKTCMSCPKSIPAVYIGHKPMWICHIPPTYHAALAAK